MTNVLMRGAQRKPRKSDIVNTYYRLLELHTPEFYQYQPHNALEVMVKASITHAIENPKDGEQHRIYNRLIGKPMETSVNVDAHVDLTKSGLYKAILENRKAFDEPKQVEVTEDRLALEASQPWFDPNYTPGRKKKVKDGPVRDPEKIPG